MSFVYDQKVVDSMYGSHVVSMAVDYGVDLVKMWPLQTNQELENDVKYAENLQVMFSGMMTQVLLKRSEEVDQSVAEAVYEGMDVLPGVDPEIIRTLMDANRACIGGVTEEKRLTATCCGGEKVLDCDIANLKKLWKDGLTPYY